MESTSRPSVIPKKNEAYKTKTYWEERYQAEPTTTFDWFKSYGQIRSYLVPSVLSSNDCRILNLGCGNSTLAEDLYDDGFRNVVSIDFSRIVIDQMRERNQKLRPALEWVVLDIRRLDFPNDSFDVVIDKGTMDALMCERGDVWEPSEELCREVKQEVDEVDRVLRPGGCFVYVTFGQPHFRRRHLERPSWELTVHSIGEVFHYFCYVMKKTNAASNESEL